MLLHGLGDIDDGPMIRVGDSLAYMSGQASLVLSNPPFGVHSPVKVHATDNDPLAWYEPARGRTDFSYSRPDFVSTTANRPLKFLQHVASSLEPGGRAAVVVPDNALFVDRDGETVRRHLLRNFDVHTLLRLPAGAIPPGGIRSNVLFFNRPTEPPRDTPCTRRLWVYDLRAERFPGDKRAPLQRDAFDDFVACYLPGRDHDERKETERFRAFAYEDLVARDAANLDLWWDEDAAEEERRPPHLIAEEIVNDLSVALGEFSAITDILRARHAESADGW
jgi:type I restriction enzyme M protein